MDIKIKLMIVEDHELTRNGIVYSLGKLPKLEIIAEAEDGKKAIDLIGQNIPDLILMDIGLPFMDGIEVTQKIKEFNENIKIIMLTSYSEQEKVFAAFQAGASAYCMKDIKMDSLSKIIDIVMDGGIWFDPKIAEFILNLLPIISKQTNKAKRQGISGVMNDIELTVREKEILQLIGLGYNNKNIADELSLSIHTVKNHVSNVLTKLALDDRTQAAIYALKEGLI